MAEPLIIVAGSLVAAKVGAELVKVGGALLGRVAGPSADELGLHYGEKVKTWRTSNLFKGAAKAHGMLTERGVEAQEVPLRVLWPMLEQMSLCDDETLTDRWAALLANAADPKFVGMIHPTYAAILAELSPLDVRLLAWIYETYNPFERGVFSSAFPFDLSVLPHLDPAWEHDGVMHSSAVLEKQGILRTVVPELDVKELKETVLHWTQPNSRWTDFSPHHKFQDGRGGQLFTRMGAEFVRACSNPHSKHSLDET